MVQKCQNCGKQIVKFPVKRQEDKSFLENFNEGTINWKNMFKMELQSIAWIIIILIIALSYHNTINRHTEVIKNVCEFNTEDNCCELEICPEVIEENCCRLAIMQEPNEYKYVPVEELS